MDSFPGRLGTGKRISRQGSDNPAPWHRGGIQEEPFRIKGPGGPRRDGAGTQGSAGSPGTPADPGGMPDAPGPGGSTDARAGHGGTGDRGPASAARDPPSPWVTPCPPGCNGSPGGLQAIRHRRARTGIREPGRSSSSPPGSDEFLQEMASGVPPPMVQWMPGGHQCSGHPRKGKTS